MEHQIEFGPAADEVAVTSSGIASVAGFARMNEKIVNDTRFIPPMRALVDHTGSSWTTSPPRTCVRSAPA
jgi:hypothetical protein